MTGTRPSLHASITAERVCAAVERHMTSLDDPGFCTSCGADAEGVEPDAERVECEQCGNSTIHGAEELMLQLL